MNTGFVMLPREIESKLSTLRPFDYKLMVRIISNCVFINQYEHNGIILNKGEWQRSLSQLQKDMTYFDKKEIVPTKDILRASIKRLVHHKFLTTNTTSYTTIFRLDEALINLCFPKDSPQVTPQVTPQVFDVEPHYNNNVLNINNNVLNNKVLKKQLTNIDSNNNLISKGQKNFAEAFLMAYGKHPSPIQIQDFLNYIQEGFEEDLICHAIEISARVTSNVAYLWGVLRNWTKQGIKTLESVMTENKKQSKQVTDHEKNRSEFHEKYSDLNW
jgi:DnaD/phage-associated family protein